MFSTARKTAQQTAQRLIAGHFTLIAWWTLRHAGVFEAILKHEAAKGGGEGLNPLVFATRTNMAPEVLQALLDYLVGADLLATRGDQVFFTSEGRALLDQEDGVLDLMRAYQPVLNMSEHLLAKLKSYSSNGTGAGGSGGGGGGGGGVSRQNDYLLESQAKRFLPEVYPAVKDLVGRHHFGHLLDIACGTGEMLIYLASKLKKVVGVGIGADALMVRRANAAISAADLEKRLISVAANPIDVCRDTSKTFDRIGISRQLWQEIDLVIATGVFTDLTTENSLPTIARALAGVHKHFPRASLLVIEPVSSPRFERNYYAPELALLMRLTRSVPWTGDRWHDLFTAAGYHLHEEVGLVTDGLSLFLLKPP